MLDTTDTLLSSACALLLILEYMVELKHAY